VQFYWDPAKDEANRRKHGMDFVTATEVFDDPFCLIELNSIADREERWQAIGQASGSVLLLVVHTIDGEHGEEIRIISARKVERDERRNYEFGQV
jgi:uncharacterized DUF497 family protein